MEIRAVVFDFDGVLAQTMEDNYRAWVKATEPHFSDLMHEEYMLLEGMSTLRVAETLLKRRGLSALPAADIVREKERFYLMDNHFSLYPGVEEMLKRVGSLRPMALVTGASRSRLERTLSSDLRARFQAVITADDQVRPKPDPMPYLMAAERLGKPPECCLVVENAPLGIRSAKGAGMTCLGVCSTLSPSHLSEADHIVTDASAMAAFLEEVLCAEHS